MRVSETIKFNATIYVRIVLQTVQSKNLDKNGFMSIELNMMIYERMLLNIDFKQQFTQECF